MKTGVYPGSFDPPTIGHVHMIEIGSKKFDRLIVVLAANRGKQSTFSVEHRLRWLSAIVGRFPNVQVEHSDVQYTVNAADALGARYLLRGVRDEADEAYEKRLAAANRDINPDVETVLVKTPLEFAHVSSSLVRGLVGYVGWEAATARYLPREVIHDFHLHNGSEVAGHYAAAVRCLSPSASSSVISDCYGRAVEAYMSSGRHHHDFRHPASLVAAACVPSRITDSDLSSDAASARCALVRLALFYHDVVYVPGAGDNELRSANWADEDLVRLGVVDKEYLAAVRYFIMASRHSDVAPLHELEAVVRDLDLSILAADAPVYDRYARNIRREYAMLSDDDWRTHRAAFLQRFLRREQIFWTKYGVKTWQFKARQNMGDELTRLIKHV